MLQNISHRIETVIQNSRELTLYHREKENGILPQECEDLSIGEISSGDEYELK